MTDKSIKIGVVLLLLGTSFLISFAFFCIDNTRSETFFRQNQENIKSLVLQIDSLERIINSTFKEMKDTPYEFIKRNAKKLGRANDFFDNPQFIKVFNK